MSCVRGGWFLPTSQRHLHLHLQAWDCWMGLKSGFLVLLLADWGSPEAPSPLKVVTPGRLALGALSGNMVPKSIHQWDFLAPLSVSTCPMVLLKCEYVSAAVEKVFVDTSSKATSGVCLVEVRLYHSWGSLHKGNGSVLVTALAGSPVPLRDACFWVGQAKRNLEPGFSTAQ